MKNFKQKLIPVLIILITTISCKKDFLDVPDKTTVLRQAYVVDLKTTKDYLNGMYFQFSRLIGYTALPYSEVISDNIKPTPGSFAFDAHYMWVQQADDSRPGGSMSESGLNANGLWLNGIQLAQGCSFVIESANKYRSENPELADNLQGQAYTIRAFVHLIMVNVFAQSYSFTANASHPGIPYTEISDWTEPARRISVKEVYDEMVADLSAAIPLLPAAQTTPLGFNHALINKNAAKAILARTFLFKGDWQSAINLAEDVVAEVPIMTGVDNYPSKLFTNEDTEAIFQLAPASESSPQGAGPFTSLFAGFLFDFNLLVSTSDMATILNEDPQDVRSAWVQTDGSVWMIKKYPKDVIPGFDIPSASYFETLIRSSEMYLTLAECYAKLNKENIAITYLDAIRTRASPTAPPTVATGITLLDAIYKERRKELCFEGLRMFDIQRWKQSVNRIDAPGPSAQDLPYGSDRAIAPIPVSDVDQLGMSQNPGY